MAMTTTVVVTDRLKRKVIRFVKKNGYITNRQCRDLLGLGYDQVIALFNHMVGTGELTRIGRTSSIRYVLPDKDDETPHG